MWSRTGFPKATLQFYIKLLIPFSPEKSNSIYQTWNCSSKESFYSPQCVRPLAMLIPKDVMADCSFYNWALAIKTKLEAHKICSSLIWNSDFLHGCISPWIHSTVLLIPRLCQRPSLPTPYMCILLVSYPVSIFFLRLFRSCQPFLLAGERPIQWHSCATTLNKWFSVQFSLCIILFTARLMFLNCRCFNECMPSRMLIGSCLGQGCYLYGLKQGIQNHLLVSKDCNSNVHWNTSSYTTECTSEQIFQVKSPCPEDLVPLVNPMKAFDTELWNASTSPGLSAWMTNTSPMAMAPVTQRQDRRRGSRIASTLRWTNAHCWCWQKLQKVLAGWNMRRAQL